MKTPISYYGGKQRLASKIIPYIPKHTVYCEPFCGGAAVLFSKPWPKATNTNNYREIINDIDGDLINFFKQLRDNGEELCRRLALTPYSELEHQLAKAYKTETNDIERARKYYIAGQMSFAYSVNAGWHRSVYSENHAATHLNKVLQLPDFVSRLMGVYISNTDALKCIAQFDSPQTFFYIDPPYVGANQGHYSGYTQEHFNALIETLKKVKGSFILSCYENEALKDTEWERVVFEAHCTASGKGQTGRSRDTSKKQTELGDRKRFEHIYIKQAETPREEIQKLYLSGAYDCFQGLQF